MKAYTLGFAVLVAACGGSTGGDDVPADTSGGVRVEAVSPCTGESATVNTLATRFDPATVTVTAGQVVKFVNDVGHDIKPALSGDTDDALAIPEGQTKCFRFNVTGSFGFRCSIHGFVGSVTVQ